MIIYLITNKLNNKQYIGQTICPLDKRWKRHCWNCTTNYNDMPIDHAIKKYGKENFTVELIQECGSMEELNQQEKYWAIKLNTFSPNGYNLKAGNGRGVLSEETKRKISAANKGKIISAETRQKQSQAHKGNKLSAEAKAKLSAFWKGKPLPAQARENSLKSCAKTYILISPVGDRIEIYNMAQFCRDNNLSKSKMSEVIKGKRKHYKGWTNGHST